MGLVAKANTFMKKYTLAAALFLYSSLSLANGLEALDRFLAEVQSGTAEFTQTVTAPEKDGQPGRVSRSSGTFAFERPGKFRFDYEKPFPQLIVGDGNTLWVYDEDLNQATSRAQKDALDNTPAAIISSTASRTALEQNFSLKDLAEENGRAGSDGIQWVEAQPKASDGQLRSLRIGFQGNRLVALDITDNFAQHSALRFNNFKTNTPVDAKLFRFDPPADADVIRDTP